MAQRTTTKKNSKKTTTQKVNSLQSYKNKGLTFLAGFAGMSVAIPLAFAVVMPTVRGELASASADLGKQAVQLRTAADTISCVAPTSASGPSASSAVTASSVGQNGPSGQPSTPNTPSSPFVQKLVSGVMSNVTGTISDTGPNSSNQVEFTNTSTVSIENNNDINVNNTNSQSSKSGDSNVSQNTTGGSSSTGTASNENSAKTGLTVNN